MKFYFRIGEGDQTADELRRILGECGHEVTDIFPDADYVVQYQVWSDNPHQKQVMVLIGSFYTERWVHPNAICIDGATHTVQVTPDALTMEKFVITKPIPLRQFVYEFLPLTTV